MGLPTIDISTTFVGSIKLTGNDFRQDKFSEYVNARYPDVIDELLGNPLLNDLETLDPLPEKYTDLLNGVSYFNTEEEKTYKVKGLLSTVYQLLYFEIVRDNFNAAHPGNVKGRAEVSERLTNNENAAKAAVEYNRGVRDFNNQIIPFIENYTDFEQPITSIVGSTINTTATKYLLDGDAVKIGGIEYTVSNLVANTSFDVDGTPETSATTYLSNPFELAECNEAYPVHV